jgi:hypothetical protein
MEIQDHVLAQSSLSVPPEAGRLQLNPVVNFQPGSSGGATFRLSPGMNVA